MSTSPVYPCNRCQGPMISFVDRPNEATGCIIIILGISLTPVCLGIPILIYGLSMMGQATTMWQCSNCGLSLRGIDPIYAPLAPQDTQTQEYQSTEKANPAHIAIAVTAGVLTLLIIVGIFAALFSDSNNLPAQRPVNSFVSPSPTPTPSPSPVKRRGR